MEAADHRNAGVAHGTDEVVSLKDHVAGAPDRAEEGEQRATDQVEVADGGEGWLVPPERGRIAASLYFYSGYLHHP
jgi:hypothetical protein